MTRDRGSTTLLAMAVGAVVITSGGLALAVVESTTRHTRLAHAADASALAGARSPGAPDCDFAARVAESYEVTLDSCAAQGLDTVVTVSLEPGGLLQRAAELAGQDLRRMVVTARAGP